MMNANGIVSVTDGAVREIVAAVQELLELHAADIQTQIRAAGSVKIGFAVDLAWAGGPPVLRVKYRLNKGALSDVRDKILPDPDQKELGLDEKPHVTIHVGGIAVEPQSDTPADPTPSNKKSRKSRKAKD